MKKEYKIITLLCSLILLIIICKRIFVLKDIKYSIKVNDVTISITEKYKNNNYSIEIKTSNSIYPLRIYDDINGKRKIIKDLYLYSDDSIQCILPVINDKVYTDIICIKNGLLYDYHTIVGENKDLDDFINKIELYDITNFNDEISISKVIDTIKFNKINNLNNKIAITTYRGLIVNEKSINLFDKDIYNNKISTFVNGYYIIANYNDLHSFNYFYVVNLYTNEIKKLKVRESISFDSYIQGVVDNKIYLYDKDNEIQYEISLSDEKINIVSNNNYVKYYNNNKWEKLNKLKANKEVLFNYNSLDNIFTNYDYTKEEKDFYYLFKKNNKSYSLYRVDKNNIDCYKYLFDVPTTNINFKDNYLYYVHNNNLYYYSDKTGLKVILTNSEFEFNDTIKYYIY